MHRYPGRPTPAPFVKLVEKRLISFRNIWIEEGQK
jgi:hypothetical protein